MSGSETSKSTVMPFASCVERRWLPALPPDDRRAVGARRCERRCLALRELRANVGVAAYSVDNTRLGAPLTAIDVALTPVSWFGILVGGRAFVLPNYRGARLTATAWDFGFRIRTRN